MVGRVQALSGAARDAGRRRMVGGYGGSILYGLAIVERTKDLWYIGVANNTIPRMRFTISAWPLNLEYERQVIRQRIFPFFRD